MKKLNFLKLSICAMLMTAAAVFTSCVDDNEDKGMPYLEVTPGTLSFDADGKPVGEGVFQVMTNRPWTLSVEEGQDWVRPSATEGDGSATVSFNIPASNIGQRAELTFSLSNTYGVYKSVKVYVTQGDVVEPELVYKETCGAATSDPYPEATAYTGWDKTGSGASTVTYAASAGVTVRGNLSSAQNNSAAYTGSGGSNLMFGTGATYFTIQDITLPANVKGYKLSFGASYFSAPNQEIFDQLKVRLSGDGQTWTDPVPYTFKGFEDGKTWNLAYFDFTLKQASEKLYVKFESEKKPDGNYRIDDMELMTGNGGTVVDLQNGTIETQVVVTTDPVSQISATGATFHGTLNVVSGVTAAGFQYAENSASIDWAAATKVAADAVALSFSKAVTNLTENKTYAVRAYATTADGDVTGSVVTFVAKEVVFTQTDVKTLISKMTDTAADVDDNYTFTAIVCSDPAGSNFSPQSLYVMTEGATEGGNALVIYSATTIDISKYALGDKLKVQLPTDYAQLYKRFGVPQVQGISDADISIVSRGNAVTPITVTVAQLPSFVAMPVKVEGVSIATPGKWMETEKNTTINFSVGGTSLPVYLYSNAFSVFGNKPYNAGSGAMIGLAGVYNNVGQVMPRNLQDVAAFNNTTATVITGASSAVTATGATLDGSKANITGATEVGVKYTAYAENIDWSTVTTKVAAAAVADSWTVNVTGLTAGQKYAYAAYAVAPAQTYYGATQNFTTEGGAAADIITDFSLASTYPAGFPIGSANKLIDQQSFVFAGNTYTLKGTSDGGYYMPSASSPYILWGKQGGFIELPTIAGKALTKIRCLVPKDAANNVQVGIFTAAGAVVSGGESIPWPTVTVDGQKQDRTYVYNLSGTAVNTAYRMVIGTGQNAQLLKLELWYGDGGGAAQPSISAVNPTSLSWAATETDAKTIAVTGTDIDGKLTVASDAGNTSKFTFSVSGTTVTVTPKAANVGTTDVTETLTIAATGGNSKTVALTQSKPAGGSDNSYLWTTASGDLGTSAAVASSVTKGEPELTWGFVPVWNAAAYLGFAGGATGKGLQVGSGGNPVKSFVLTTVGYTKGITKIVIETSGANNINATLEVKVGTTVLKSGGADNVSITNASTAYTFETSTAVTGLVTLTWTNNSAIGLYIKSIAINPAN